MVNTACQTPSEIEAGLQILECEDAFLSMLFLLKKGGVIKAELWEAEYILVLCKAMLIWALGP